MVLGDREHLGRMVRNLVDNAARFARHRVLITVVDQPPGEVGIEVRDDGPGIPAEERERVFARFVRLDTSRGRASGSSGLGLAIAKEIATAHGGHITIEQAPGGGALVRITFAARRRLTGQLQQPRPGTVTCPGTACLTDRQPVGVGLAFGVVLLTEPVRMGHSLWYCANGRSFSSSGVPRMAMRAITAPVTSRPP
ncbi:ATP-binding protein [Kitasatospora sp. MAP5-34]|uniref:sensor histidine kinase n=1 Tax=Kitasatospora sp. MAP5-34 TaxID=3035102 RepID=UPI002473C029|nr:ATP-binding protein [Kitasatospora sp. MAP5-34]MDH6578170.1 anti-sigma regulatory factor (Ser/Thr protein kinase) [Kitasatospora sp. MAP5-34]